MTTFRFAFLLGLLFGACVPTTAADVPKPVKVFILAGQSNMEGQAVADLDGKDYNGGKGTLKALLDDPKKAALVKHLRTEKGAWTVRDDVWVRYQREKQPLLAGSLSIGFSVYGGTHHFGPELQFGHIVGDHFPEQVLLIKTAWGGKSLYKDFRPPSSGGEVGPYYTKMIADVRTALENLKTDFPTYADRGYELAGFVWYQGWNDGVDPKKAIPEYEANLVNLINDVRKEFKAPKLPVVVGELTGPWVDAPAEWTTLRKAQAAAAARPEFQGNVLFVPTRDFVRPAKESPNPGHGHHEFGNAETYFLVGDALGKGMVELLAPKPKETPEPKPKDEPIQTKVAPKPATNAEFKLTFDKAALDQPFTGRVYVMLLRSESRTIPGGLNWFNPEPTFAKDVKNWKPGEELIVDDTALSITPLKDVKPGTYFAQAVLDRDLGGISFAASPGNVYSKPVKLDFDPKTSGGIALALDQVAKEPEFKETDTVKLVDLESALLTKFHGKKIAMKAGVILPPSFVANPEKKYPVVYEVPGFGGDHRGALGIAGRKPWDLAGTEAIWVVLDPRCRLGHHVFADSENNGPCGKALVEELIPAIEKRFRGNGKRLVTGHSSGGWSSLWLQVTYPETFLGCWSTSPDPVDFRDFQRIDLYNPGSNMFVDSTQTLRPIARRDGKPALFVKPFSDMEVVMGRGGQLASFEASFSPRGTDGQPVRLWDRKSGAIRTDVAKDWEKYDIRLVLERNWSKLGPKLKGKVHVYMGDADTFYLEGATRLLKESLATLGSDAVVELFPGKDHGLMTAPLRERISKEMAAALKE